jgi:hypothetical protein
MDLLRRSVRPFGRNVVGRKLDAHPRRTVNEHLVKLILGVDRAAEQPGPEAAPR